MKQNKDWKKRFMNLLESLSTSEQNDLQDWLEKIYSNRKVKSKLKDNKII